MARATVARGSGSRQCALRREPELYRLKGELLLARGRAAGPDAEIAFRQAIDIARRQGTKSWELRSVLSLSRLFLNQGKREGARRLLAEAYGWFTEGFDTLVDS